MVLSALIVVHNEEATLEDCIASVRFADEIVVVLDKCTDGLPTGSAAVRSTARGRSRGTGATPESRHARVTGFWK